MGQAHPKQTSEQNVHRRYGVDRLAYTKTLAPVVPVRRPDRIEVRELIKQQPKNLEDRLISYNIYNESLSQYDPFDEDKFATRLRDNAIKRERDFEDKLHKIRLTQIKEDQARLNSEIVLPKPKNSYYSNDSSSKKFELFRKIDLKFFWPKPKRPELTQEILDFIKDCSRPQPLTQVLVELDGVQILRKDIQTLLGLNWLNDEIINAYMHLLVVRGKQGSYKSVYAFNTFFYPKVRDTGYNLVKRWTRKVDIFSHHYILVPVHLGNHWCLAVINTEKKQISYYDSLGGSSHTCTTVLLDYLRSESNDKLKQDLDKENWKCINEHNSGLIPKQENGSDCGVFACTYAEYITREAKLEFSQKDMPYFRQKMIYEIVKGRILQS